MTKAQCCVHRALTRDGGFAEKFFEDGRGLLVLNRTRTVSRKAVEIKVGVVCVDASPRGLRVVGAHFLLFDVNKTADARGGDCGFGELSGKSFLKFLKFFSKPA